MEKGALNCALCTTPAPDSSLSLSTTTTETLNKLLVICIPSLSRSFFSNSGLLYVQMQIVIWLGLFDKITVSSLSISISVV